MHYFSLLKQNSLLKFVHNNICNYVQLQLLWHMVVKDNKVKCKTFSPNLHNSAKTHFSLSLPFPSLYYPQVPGYKHKIFSIFNLDEPCSPGSKSHK